MSNVEEIEDAIRSLPSDERERLVRHLPAILPELHSEAAWERIIRDPRPCPKLSALLDEAEMELRRDPASCPETSEEEFDRHS